MQPLSPPCSNTAAASAWAQAQRQRWDRISLGVRLGYNPHQAQLVRLWLALTDHLVAQGVLGELKALQRTLAVLLQVAHDAGLPWFWRSVCLEHTAWPLARLQSLSRRQGPAQVPDMSDLHAAVRMAQAQLALPAQGSAP